jgi:hypothetical protein
VNLDLCAGAEGRAFLARLADGAPWREALEAQLLHMELVRAERLMQVLKEGRGAWLPLVLARGDRTAWLLGNALSGTALVLARLGLATTVVDPSPERGALAVERDRRLADGRLSHLVWDRSLLARDLPPPDVAVLEGPVPTELGSADEVLAFLRRVGARRVHVVADNRFAYKRSTGVRADLRVESPWRFVRRALEGAELSLAAQRRRLAERAPVGAFALYPHRWDFSLVVDLVRDAGPQLFIGPGERTNLVKLLAHRVGLFPVFAPSFAVGGPLPERSRADDWLAAVSAATGADAGRVEHFVATRGNNALLLTSAGLALHVPLGPDQERQMRRHHALLARVRSLAPRLPVPRPLFLGEVDGVLVQAESREGAINGAQLVHEWQRERVLLPACADLLALAVTSPPRRPDDAELERLVRERARAAAERAGRDATREALLALGERCAEQLAGTSFPRVFGHNDLRAKHVAVASDGRPGAFLDLGCAREDDLPFVDLLNLVLHDHKDAARTSLGEAWRAAVARRLPEPLEAVLARYVEALRLPPAYDAAIRAAYPVFVAAAAEQNWDYSRPRWVHRQLDL